MVVIFIFAEAKGEAMAKLRYFGHSTFQIIYDDGTSVFIDPYFSAEGRDYPSVAKDAHWVKQCDAIFVTHEHHDHCEPETITEIAERTWASVVAPKPVLATLRVPDRIKVEVRTGDKFDVKGLRVEVMKAVHPQSTYPVGYIIEKDGIRVYHAGDTYEFAEMTGISCDYALLPIGGSMTMDPIGAEKAAKEISCKYIVPMHYSTWNRIAQSPREFANGLKGSRVTVLPMKFGEEITLAK